MAATDDPAVEGTEARPDRDDEGLLLDRLLGRLDAFRVLREHHADDAAAMLEEIGISGRVEEDMVGELGDATPLAHPERFWDAHRTMMRALEVLDRNGPRTPSPLPVRGPFAPLKPVAAALVQQLVSTQVRSYERRLIEHLRRLYAMREVASLPGSDEFVMLRLARKQATRMTPDFRRGGVGLHTLVGTIRDPKAA